MVKKEGESLFEKHLEKWASTKYAKLVGKGVLSKENLSIITPKAARYHGNPILTRGGDGAWDEIRVDNPTVIYDPDDQLYKMWYSGHGNKSEDPSLYGKTGYATSDDGISWTKDSDNPIFDDTNEEGYAHHHTEVADVIVDYIEGEKTYLMLYEQKLRDANWNIKKDVPKVAKSTNGTDWTVIGKVTSVAEGEVYDGGRIWVDRDGNYHIIIKLWPYGPGTPSVWHHFTSKDFETWEKSEKTYEFGHEIFDKSYKRVDDLEIVPFGRYLLGFANYFTGGNGSQYHQPLEIMAGLSWNNMQKVGNCIYPAKEIAEGAGEFSYHEASFVTGLEPYGECPRIYYFEQWNPASGEITRDINMAYLMLGEKRTYPVLSMSTLAAGSTTSVGWGGDCTEIPLHGVEHLTLTIKLTYDANASDGAKVYIYPSEGGVNYDTEAVTTYNPTFSAGDTVKESFYPTPNPRFIQVAVENLDADYDITDLKVYATVS